MARDRTPGPGARRHHPENGHARCPPATPTTSAVRRATPRPAAAGFAVAARPRGRAPSLLTSGTSMATTSMRRTFVPDLHRFTYIRTINGRPIPFVIAHTEDDDLR